MGKKIIFFDIDGTLADERTFKVPESTIKAMNMARENGHILIINTGRGSCGVEDSIRNLPVDGFVYGCGTEIEYHNKVISLHQFSKELRHRIVNSSLRNNLENVLEGNTALYYPPYPCYADEIIHMKTRYEKQGFPISYYDHDADVVFQKMACWWKKDEDIEAFKEEFKDELSYIDRGDFYEILPAKYNKATGIQEMIDYLNIPHEDTFAIGDSTNDLTMLEYVNTSIGMGNSAPALLPLVDYVTTDINDDGIYNALKHFNII